MNCAYEIFLKHGQVGSTEWREFLVSIAKFLDNFSVWQICVCLEQNVVHYYLLTPRPMPTSLGLVDFLLKPTANLENISKTSPRLYFNQWSDNFVNIFQKLYKRQYRLNSAVISIHSLHNFLSSQIYLAYTRGQATYRRRLAFAAPETFLGIDFDHSRNFLFKKFPKYLKLEKVTHLLSETSAGALLEVDPFPYFDAITYLQLTSYDFAKHSLVIGASGSGKSRFIASLIHQIEQTNSGQYKVIVIDPHDALYRDCAGIQDQSVINFQSLASSIDLFSTQTDDVNASVELMLLLFRNLINDGYNGRLERVLRYANFLLTAAQEFSFLTLRKLLLDLEYRNQLVSTYQFQVPASVAHFFLTDFNELKTEHYNDAIAPIIAFIDEMQMVPIFNSESHSINLTQAVQNHFLNIFSLNRLKLGDKVTRTISGLLLQQLFLLTEREHAEHYIIIVDEVAVVENPILTRFLSELRKYHASVILAGQYFDQISPELRAAIFANVTNFYLFRTSLSDAILLTQNLPIKVEGSDDERDSQKLLIGLKARECLVQISAGEEVLPVFKARTTDYLPPEIDSCMSEQLFNCNNTITPEPPPTTDFDFNLKEVDLETFTKTYSSSRKTKEQK